MTPIDFHCPPLILNEILREPFAIASSTGPDSATNAGRADELAKDRAKEHVVSPRAASRRAQFQPSFRHVCVREHANTNCAHLYRELSPLCDTDFMCVDVHIT